jgi:ABC-type multidrug transport system fused ATPase/permease subunit
MAKEETEKPIELSDLYDKAQDDLKYNGDKAWESIKLCTALSSTLITVTLGLLGAIDFLPINFIVKAVLILVLIIFPLMIKTIVTSLSKNFHRECRRMYENMTILMKIEDELPDRKDLSDSRNFTKEKKYIPHRWEKDYISSEKEKNLFSDTEDFVATLMEKKDALYSNMKPIFSILKGISYVLVLILISLAIIIIIQG